MVHAAVTGPIDGDRMQDEPFRPANSVGSVEVNSNLSVRERSPIRAAMEWTAATVSSALPSRIGWMAGEAVGAAVSEIAFSGQDNGVCEAIGSATGNAAAGIMSARCVKRAISPHVSPMRSAPALRF